MPFYMVAQDWDNTVELVKLNPQGKTVPGVETERIYVAEDAYPDGESQIPLVFTYLTNAEKNSLDDQFGVAEDNLFNDITFQFKDNRSEWVIWNAKVEYPEVGKNARRSENGWSQVTYIIHLYSEVDD